MDILISFNYGWYDCLFLLLYFNRKSAFRLVVAYASAFTSLSHRSPRVRRFRRFSRRSFIPRGQNCLRHRRRSQTDAMDVERRRPPNPWKRRSKFNANALFVRLQTGPVERQSSILLPGTTKNIAAMLNKSRGPRKVSSSHQRSSMQSKRFFSRRINIRQMTNKT